MAKGGDEIASLYLQPRTGSDIALFKAIAKALIERNGVDENFVNRNTSGFNTLLEHLRQSDRAALQAECGVSNSSVEAVAEAYARSENTIFAWGMGVTHHRHGVENIEWISNLALLRGMIGKRSAGLLPLRGHSNVQGIGTIGVKPVLPEEVFRRIEEAYSVSLPTGKGLHTLASLEKAHRGEIDAALMMGGNLYAATPDTAWAEEAFNRIGFKPYLTTTLNISHVNGVEGGESLILPVCARDEEPEPTTQESMFNYVRMSDGGNERIASVRSEVSVLAELGERLLPQSPVDFGAFREHRKVREAIARTVPGMEQLKDIDVARQEFHVRGRILHTPEFRTSDGRANFVIPMQAGFEPGSTRGFRLMTVRSEGQFNSIIYEHRDSYRNVDDRWSALINLQDALEIGVSDGDTIDITSDNGRMEAVRVRPFDIPRGCVAVYYPEANVLCTRESDPRSHTPAFKSVAVSINRHSPATEHPAPAPY